MTTPYEPPPPPPPSAGAPNNTLGLVAMILGIVSIPLVCCFYLGVPVAIAAIITGWMGKQKAEQGLANNRGQALAGFYCGIGAIVLAILGVIATLIFSFSMPGGFNYN
jgi:hypothetical protein